MCVPVWIYCYISWEKFAWTEPLIITFAIENQRKYSFAKIWQDWLSFQGPSRWVTDSERVS